MSTKKSASSASASSTPSKKSTANGAAAMAATATPGTAKTTTVAAAPSDGLTPAQRSAAKLKKLPVSRRIERQISIAQKRWVKLARLTAGWSAEFDIAFGEALDAVTAVIKVSKSFEDAFEPAKKKGGGAPRKQLDVGTFVDVTDKAIRHYAEIIDTKDLKGLKVKRVAGKKVVCTTVSGETVILPRQHVAPAVAVSDAEYADAIAS